MSEEDMGFDNQVNVSEIEEMQSELRDFDGDSKMMVFLVLLSIVFTTFLCGYGLSLLIGALIR
jgi:hypothetical protein